MLDNGVARDISPIPEMHRVPSFLANHPAKKAMSSSVLRMWAVLTVAAFEIATQAQTHARTV